ncbi:hypothetical protein [Streptomyces rimosus]|uniref:hypothetical protein n=1 Tax=Streptomyces rimosus TaxID=1927 RepID=UPI00131DF43D|nr:hypothetical protein [Streptomyces rimosus]
MSDTADWPTTTTEKILAEVEGGAAWRARHEEIVGRLADSIDSACDAIYELLLRGHTDADRTTTAALMAPQLVRNVVEARLADQVSRLSAAARGELSKQ